jgi:replication factor C subunit 3/5
MQDQKLWVERYRPLTLADANLIHKEQNQILSRLAESDDFPHVLLYGPSGAGKRTLTKAVLQALYGTNSVHKIKSEHKEYKVSSASSTTCSAVVFSSVYHIEVTPSEADNYDRVIVQKLIKEVAGSQQLDSKQQKCFKVVVIHELDQLTHSAQASLRRTMETFMPTCRIIANCESLSKVIMPLRSRCLQVRVPAPQKADVANILSRIAGRENFELPQVLAENIAEMSRRNMRRAIMMLQTLRVKNQSLKPSTAIPMPDYEGFICEIATDVNADQSPNQLKLIRGKLYELLTKGITADVIFQTLCREFLKTQQSRSTLVESIKPQVLRYAVLFEGRCREGSKPIMHLEAFLARTMALIKQSQMGGFRR